jgi:hypothetical protein
LNARILFALCGVMIAAPVMGTEAAHPKASALDPFLSRLVANGRAAVRIERHVHAADGEDAVSGRLTLEPPDRARLDFDRTGEKVTLRADGGEWLQPKLKQCVRLGPARARVALEWWDLFMTPQRERFIERKLSAGRVMIVRAGESAAPDTAWVTLRGDLPAALEIAEPGGGRSAYGFSNWKFSRAHGRADFELAAPHGWESVDLP